MCVCTVGIHFVYKYIHRYCIYASYIQHCTHAHMYTGCTFTVVTTKSTSTTATTVISVHSSIVQTDKIKWTFCVCVCLCVCVCVCVCICCVYQAKYTNTIKVMLHTGSQNIYTNLNNRSLQNDLHKNKYILQYFEILHSDTQENILDKQYIQLVINVNNKLTTTNKYTVEDHYDNKIVQGTYLYKLDQCKIPYSHKNTMLN